MDGGGWAAARRAGRDGGAGRDLRGGARPDGRALGRDPGRRAGDRGRAAPRDRARGPPGGDVARRRRRLRRRGRGDRRRPRLGPARGRDPVQGLEGRRARGRGGGAAVISILIAAAVGLAFTLLGTPAAIRAFRVWGWGQRIREDGPHTHFEKVGTPTMGGIVMLGALVAAYLASRFSLAAGITFSPAGWSLILAAVGFGAVGFVDDYLKVRRQRSLGLSKTQKFMGTALVSVLFAIVVVAFTGDTGTSTSLSFLRPTALDLGVVFYIWVFVVLTSSSHAVNLTDGLDGLAAGSSILVLAGYLFIAFWQFRHTCGDVEGAAQVACYEVDLLAMQDTAIIAAAMMGAAAGFLWWNAAPARI